MKRFILIVALLFATLTVTTAQRKTVTDKLQVTGLKNAECVAFDEKGNAIAKELPVVVFEKVNLGVGKYGWRLVGFNEIPGEFAIALGKGANARGEHSIALGYSATASESRSASLGWSANARGEHSTAIGCSVTASKSRSTSLGWGTTASGGSSTAIGCSTTASGDRSTSLGWGTTASGEHSTAIGCSATASGGYSTALGYRIKASGEYSTALGYCTEAPSFSETSLGCYNTLYEPSSSVSTVDSDRLFVVGNGGGEDNRSDAVVVYKNGNMDLNGLLKLKPMKTPGSPKAGAIYFDNTDNKLKCYDGTAWQNLY